MKRISALLLAAALAVSLSGCVWFADDGDTDETPTTYEPVQDEVEATPEPERTENPVSAFYSDYYDACGAMEELFQSRLENEATKEAADTLIYLAEHDLIASQGKVTFGWLLSTDTEGGFSSSVSGAAEGNGTITAGIAQQEPEDETEMELEPIAPAGTPQLTAIPEENEAEKKEYTLSFIFASGAQLTGTLEEDALKYRENSSDGYTVEIVTENGVWESTVTRGDGLVTVLRCDGDGLHFTVSTEPKRQETTETLYCWASDSSGARRVGL